MHTVNLGDKVRDMVTGFTGIAVARTQWLNGCVRIAVQVDKLGKDSKIEEANYFDEPQLEIIKRGAVKVEIPTQIEPVRTEPRKTGGPLDLPADRRGGGARR